MEFGLDFYLLAVFAVLIIGISKSGFVGGGAIMGVPLLSLVIEPQVAAGILLPLLFAFDLFNSWKYRKDWSFDILKVIVPGAMLGVLFGSLTWQFLDADTLRLGIGLLAIFFVARFLLLSRGDDGRLQMSDVSGFFLSIISGLTSFVAHAGGPPVDAYLLSRGMDKTRLVATNIYYYLIVNAAKLLPYFLLGQLSASNMGVSLTLAPLIPVGMFLGYYLHRIVSQKLFNQLAYAMLALAGFKLAYDGLVALL